MTYINQYTHINVADCLLQEFEQKIVALDERNGFLPFHGSVEAAMGAGLHFLFVGFSDVVVAVSTGHDPARTPTVPASVNPVEPGFQRCRAHSQHVREPAMRFISAAGELPAVLPAGNGTGPGLRAE